MPTATSISVWRKRERDRQRDFRIGDPDAVDEAECLDVFRQRLAHNNGDFGFGRALVFTQLGQPSVAPVFGALAIPKESCRSFDSVVL